MSETTKGKRKLIIAAEPENLKKNLIQKERLLAEILPELKSISNVGFNKPKIMFFKGREGLREIYWDTLKVKSKMEYWVSPIQDIAETVGIDFLMKYIDERTKKGIWIKSLHISNKKFPYKYFDPATYEKTLRKVRFSPPEVDIANTMKVFYDLLWNVSKEYGSFETKKSYSEE